MPYSICLLACLLRFLQYFVVGGVYVRVRCKQERFELEEAVLKIREACSYLYRAIISSPTHWTDPTY